MTRRPTLDAGVAGGMLVWKLRELGDWALYAPMGRLYLSGYIVALATVTVFAVGGAVRCSR